MLINNKLIYVYDTIVLTSGPYIKDKIPTGWDRTSGQIFLS